MLPSKPLRYNRKTAGRYVELGERGVYFVPDVDKFPELHDLERMYSNKGEISLSVYAAMNGEEPGNYQIFYRKDVPVGRITRSDRGFYFSPLMESLKSLRGEYPNLKEIHKQVESCHA